MRRRLFTHRQSCEQATRGSTNVWWRRRRRGTWRFEGDRVGCRSSVPRVFLFFFRCMEEPRGNLWPGRVVWAPVLLFSRYMEVEGGQVWSGLTDAWFGKRLIPIAQQSRPRSRKSSRNLGAPRGTSGNLGEPRGIFWNLAESRRQALRLPKTRRRAAEELQTVSCWLRPVNGVSSQRASVSRSCRESSIFGCGCKA